MVREVEVRLGSELAAEAVESVLDVGRVPDLAGFAVADHVEADIDLALDDVGDGAAHHAIEFGLVIGLATVFAQQQRDRVVGPRQAADVGSENPLAAHFHECPAFEARDTSRHPLTRTSKAKGHSQVYGTRLPQVTRCARSFSISADV